ncbi:cytochrome P450, partial [Zopfia rhizophila CBS 207.26]
DWSKVPIYDVIAKAVARVSNRAFSRTLLFMRYPPHLEKAIAYAQDVVVSTELIRAFPNWLKPLLIRLTPIHRQRKLASEIMGWIVQERLDTNWEGKDKLDDMIQWLADTAPPVERTMPQIVERVMALNVASIHTTTMTLTSALYTLGARWEKYTPILRKEVRQHCEGGEVTKQALSKLTRLDSFLRECGRFNIPDFVSVRLVCNARKDFRFKDGTIVPTGARVGAPSLVLHNESQYYRD